MSDEILTMLGVGATLLASGASFALFMFRQLVRLEGRMGGLEGRMGGLEGRIGVLEGRFDGLESRIGVLEGRFDALEIRFDRLEDRFVRLEEKVDDLAKGHQALARELSEFRGETRGRLGELAAGSVAG